MLLWMALTWTLASCAGMAEVREPCVDDPALCPACDQDSQCVFGGNRCHDTVDCAHVDAGLAYTMIGCSAALEHSWPPDSACVCLQSTCALDPEIYQ